MAAQDTPYLSPELNREHLVHQEFMDVLTVLDTATTNLSGEHYYDVESRNWQTVGRDGRMHVYTARHTTFVPVDVSDLLPTGSKDRAIRRRIGNLVSVSIGIVKNYESDVAIYEEEGRTFGVQTTMEGHIVTIYDMSGGLPATHAVLVGPDLMTAYPPTDGQIGYGPDVVGEVTLAESVPLDPARITQLLAEQQDRLYWLGLVAAVQERRASEDGGVWLRC